MNTSSPNAAAPTKPPRTPPKFGPAPPLLEGGGAQPLGAGQAPGPPYGAGLRSNQLTTKRTRRPQLTFHPGGSKALSARCDDSLREGILARKRGGRSIGGPSPANGEPLSETAICRSAGTTAASGLEGSPRRAGAGRWASVREHSSTPITCPQLLVRRWMAVV